MDSKKILFLLVLIILSIGFISALDISADSPLSYGQQWSFNVNLSSLSNSSEARIYLDSQQIAIVTRISTGEFVQGSYSSKVVNSNLNKDSGFLTLVCTGLRVGTYELRVESNNDSISKEIVFFEPANKLDQIELTNQLSDLENRILNLKTVITTLEEEINTKDAQISLLVKDNSELDSSLKLLDSKLRLLEQEGKSNEEILSELKNDLNVLLVEREEARKSPLSGLFAFGSENSGLLLGLFALIALVVVGVFVKSRSGSIYSNSLFGDDSELEIGPVESDESSLNETFVSPFKSIFSGLTRKKSPVLNKNKKKWAVEPYHGEVKQKEEKKFDLGDLIKRE
ncbi:MAG: hypothetical protein PHX27_03395 [Candidatus ainarchaeum sp.]|nr:hypothetical protein [Candidatus ainarchaeum sp.]